MTAVVKLVVVMVVVENVDAGVVVHKMSVTSFYDVPVLVHTIIVAAIMSRTHVLICQSVPVSNQPVAS